MGSLTVAELRLRHAQLAHRAEQRRAESRVTDGASARAAFLARDARMNQQMADDYASLLRIAESEVSAP